MDAHIAAYEQLSAIEVRVIFPSSLARAHMFWPLAIKALAEIHDNLQIDYKGRTPSSILHGVKVEDISSHTLFLPIYALYTALAYWNILGTLAASRRKCCAGLESQHQAS